MRCAVVLLFVCCGCIASRPFKDSEPRIKLSSSLVRGQLILHANFDLPREHPLLSELLLLRNSICSQLAIPGSEEPIHVYLYDSPEEYLTQATPFFRSGDARRAFFLERDGRLNVYAQWGDSVAEDLRHELTHAYVHASIQSLPLWLDEGLAEYFEISPEKQGLHTSHIDLLSTAFRQGKWSPDLMRLESLSQTGDLQQLDYAESWLWTHFLSHATPESKKLLQSYVQNLRLHGEKESLSTAVEKIFSTPHQQVIAHLAQLSDS